MKATKKATSDSDEEVDSSSDDSDEDIEQNSDDESDSSPNRRQKGKKMKPRKSENDNKKASKTIVFNVADTQYDVIKYVGKSIFGWKLTRDTHNMEWDILWTDNAVQPETLARMQTFQKINHFPGMYSLARKNYLGKNLMRMKKAFPDNFKFFPPTYLLPSELSEFKNQFSKKKNKTFILKPEASCQGRGIFLTRNGESIRPDEHYVAQRYLHKPYLIDGLKFDLRIYVLLAGCDPLKVFLLDDGLGRFCTEKYVSPTGENLDNMCMHLTNYAINKNNPNFIFNEDSAADDVGHKKSLKAVMKILEEQGHDTDALWKEIRKIIIKTFCSVQPILAHTYKSCHPDEPYNNMCFEILGFDIMLDYKLKPWLIEVNHSPSFTTDTPLDRKIKKDAVKDALTIMNISIENRNKAKNQKRCELQQRVLTGKKVKASPEERQALFEKCQKERDVWEKEHCGRYTKIFPFDDPSEAEEDYEEFMKVAQQQWEEWTGMSIKRNLKKVDVNKPPPMVFGNGPSIYASKPKDLLPPKPKASPFNKKMTPSPAAAAIVEKTNLDNEKSPQLPPLNDRLKRECSPELEPLSESMAMVNEIKMTEEESKGVVSLRRMISEEDERVVMEEEDHGEEAMIMNSPNMTASYEPKKISDLQKTEPFDPESNTERRTRALSALKPILHGGADIRGNNTRFRRPTNLIKGNMATELSSDMSYDEQKMQFLKKFGLYENWKQSEAAVDVDRSVPFKVVPMKVSSGTHVHQAAKNFNNQSFWPILHREMELDRELKNISFLRNAGNMPVVRPVGKPEHFQQKVAKRRALSLASQKAKFPRVNFNGNEFNLKELNHEALLKIGKFGGNIALHGNGMGIGIPAKIHKMLPQKRVSVNQNYFVDGHMNMHRGLAPLRK